MKERQRSWRSERYANAIKTGVMTCRLPEDDRRPHVRIASNLMMLAEDLGREDNLAQRRKYLKALSATMRDLRAYDATTRKKREPLVKTQRP